MNAPGTAAPNVYIEARYRPHPHSSIELVKFGLPNARRRRVIQSTESLIADVDGDADPNTTDSGPDAAAIAVSRVATVSSASSQLIRSQAGSSAPFGAVRRSGCSTRSACPTIAGAALPFTHNARPVGCPASGSSAAKRPSTVTAVAPHRETHSAQNVGVRTCTSLRSTVLRPDSTAVPPSGSTRFRDGDPQPQHRRRASLRRRRGLRDRSAAAV